MHPVVGLVLQVGGAEKLLHALGFESLDRFFRVGQQVPCFTVVGDNGGDERLVQLVPLFRQLKAGDGRQDEGGTKRHRRLVEERPIRKCLEKRQNKIEGGTEEYLGAVNQ